MQRNTVTENIRFLLWHQQVPRPNWIAQLADWAGCTSERAYALLHGADLEREELDNIARSTHVSSEELQFGQLVEEGTDIFQENIRYLLASLEHGQKSALAQAIGVHGTTVSDWQRGTYPTPEHRTKLLRYFHIDPGSTLEATPLFLEPFPALDRERRAWLQQRIAELDETTLRALFPALERLFGKS